MAVPKRKTTPSKRNMRRSHHRVKAVNIIEDKKVANIVYLIMLISKPVFITAKKF